MNKKETIKPFGDQLFDRVIALIESARKKVILSVNTTMTLTYFEIGRLIVEHEQQGMERAEYGRGTLKNLSKKLNDQFGRGFSVENLDRMRFFYKSYGFQNSSTVLTNSERGTEKTIKAISQKKVGEMLHPDFQLSWSHYIKLMRIENIDERRFYELECIQNNWSIKELQRQFNSSLYERLALSRNKEQVNQLAQHGQLIEKPADVLKDPYILEFLGLEEKSIYSESDLENRIIDHLQHFLLELGKGFSFVGRQVRISFDEKHYRIDLVFYNRFLRCFVLFDLKIGEAVHQDLGQIQMYVNYYDRFVKTEEENPTIGIILCKERNKAMVEITLPKDNEQIFASKYLTFLPKKEELKAVLNEALEEDKKESGGNET